MKIWITGSKGMLGTTICETLKRRDIPYLGSDKSVNITSLILLEQFLNKHKGITHIINCAAYTNVDLAEQDKEESYAINATGIQNLGKLAQRYQIPILHFSTDYVFNGESQNPYKENDYCAPIGVYGKTKEQGEALLIKECPSASIIRTSWLFGSNGKNFVETMLNLMKHHKIIRVVSDQIGRPTYCQDLANAAIALLDHKGVYHFANSGAISWYEFALEIANEGKRLGYPLIVEEITPITTSEYPTQAKRPAYSVLNTLKIEKILHQPIRKWQDALSDHLRKGKKYEQTHSSS